ncbi:hypothetical protein Q5752_006452 [Cryptotrichosporon argae]
MSASLLHQALENLTVSQAIHHPSHTPRALSAAGTPGGCGDSDVDADGSGARTPASSDDERAGLRRRERDELVRVGRGTAPGTPTGGTRTLGRRATRDPLRLLPTHVAVRVFLQLDIRSLARCDRVCRRWHKSSTLNYVWFLQNRALVLPENPALPSLRVRYIDAETSYVDPYSSGPSLRALPPVSPPGSAVPVWSKAESRRAWRLVFKSTLAPPSGARVDLASLSGPRSAASSGWSTPHAHRGAGAGHAGRWAAETDLATPDKAAMREAYKSHGGRKVGSKRRMGGQMGRRDKTGVDDDDGRFDAPW